MKDKDISSESLINGAVKTNIIEAQRSKPDSTLPGVGNEKVNDTSIPFEIDGDDEVQQRVKDIKFPNNNFIKSDDLIFPDKQDRLPRKDRIPSKIRNDDNPADVDI